MLDPVAARCQGCVRKLQRCVVSDIESPVVMERIRVRRLDVTISYVDEFRDLVAARLVRLQPTELLPIFQAHDRSQSEKP